MICETLLYRDNANKTNIFHIKNNNILDKNGITPASEDDWNSVSEVARIR